MQQHDLSNEDGDEKTVKTKDEGITSDKKKRKKQFQDPQEKRMKTTKKKKDLPCIFYQKGHCKYGSDCRFNHDAPKEEKKVIKVPSEPLPEDPTTPLVDNGKPYAPPQVPQKVLDLFSEKIAEYASDLVQKKIAFQDSGLKDLKPILQKIEAPKPEALEGAKRSPQEYVDAVINSWATQWHLLRKILSSWDKQPDQIPKDSEDEPIFTVDAVREIRVTFAGLAKRRKKKLHLQKKKQKAKQASENTELSSQKSKKKKKKEKKRSS